MVVTTSKMETLALMDKRAAVEAEMQGIIDRLTGPNGAGLSGNLVDSEGFPRADIDIPKVRAERHRLAVLRTDHQELTASIEEKLQELHSAGVSKDKSTTPLKRAAEGADATPYRSIAARPAQPTQLEAGIHNAGPAPMDEDSSNRQPFAFFDEVTDGSPAAVDGLKVGDRLVRFGSVEGGDNLLPRLGREGQINEGRPVAVVVLRRGELVHLSLTPRRWSGNGLLGCHIRPL